MALIKCPECGKEISDAAKYCPHCGYKPRSQDKLSDSGGAVSSVWSFIYSLFKDGRYWKALIMLAISVTVGVLSIYYAFESWNMDWILFVGGILLCLTGTLILFVRPIEFGRNKTSGKVMKVSTVLLILGSIAVVTHGVVRIIEPHAFSYGTYGTDYCSESNTKWEYSEETNLSGAKIRYATITSQEDNSISLILEYDPDNYKGLSELTTRYFDKSINIISRYFSIQRGINFQFDGGEVLNLTPSRYANADVYLSSKAIMIRDESSDFSRIMRLMKSSSVCKIEIVTSNGLKRYTFEVAGLKWSAF